MAKFKNPWSHKNSPWYNQEKERWYNQELNEVINLLKKNRPQWSDVYEGYPKKENGKDDLPTEDVFKFVRGEGYDKTLLTNACATRVSLGLLNGKMDVRYDFLITHGKFEGKGFIASAIGLKNWLSEENIWGMADEIIEGPTNIKNVRSILNKRNGVYIIIGGFGSSITGHASLWIGDEQDVIGGHNYVDYGGTIYFWELR